MKAPAAFVSLQFVVHAQASEDVATSPTPLLCRVLKGQGFLLRRAGCMQMHLCSDSAADSSANCLQGAGGAGFPSGATSMDSEAAQRIFEQFFGGLGGRGGGMGSGLFGGGGGGGAGPNIR